MRNLGITIAVAFGLLLSACAVQPSSPVDVISKMECKDGTSVKQVLDDNIAQFGDQYTITVGNVITGAKAAAILAKLNGVGDTVVVFVATNKSDGTPTDNDLLLAVQGGCVTGQAFMPKAQVDAMIAALPAVFTETKTWNN